MQFFENPQKAVQLISEKSGKAENEIQELIAKKKEKYSNILTDSGAAFLVAKDLGIELELEKRLSTKAKISQLENGMQNIDIEAKIMQAFQPKSFEKNNRKGKMQNLIIADESGEIRLTLWREQARKLEEEKIEKGAKLLLKNCKVQEFNGKKQIVLDYNGTMEVLEENPENTPKLEELKEGMQNVSVTARISRVFPARKFLKDNKEGKALNFEITDGKSTVRTTAWNDITQEIEKLERNDLVKIENAYTKQGMKGTELHIGWQSRIIKNPKGREIPELEERKIARKQFKELKENEIFEQKAVVLDLRFGNLFFQVCPKCGKKPEEIEGKFVCENCGQLEKAEKRIVVSAMLDDGTAVLRSVFFGKTAEELLEKTARELEEKEKTGELEEELEKISGMLAGGEIIVQGIARKNQMSKELEINARNVKKANAEKETQEIIAKIA